MSAEPDRGCLLVDKDNDIWRYDENAWSCQTEPAFGTWADLQGFAPLRVFAPLTDDGAVAVPARPSPAGTVPRPAPSSPRPFELVRHHDVTGKSGTGVVAEGVEFTDGTAALRWRGGHPATAVWPNVEEILAVHGHSGATELHWLDQA